MAGRPHDVVADHPAQVLDHRVAVVGGLAGRGVGVGAEHHRVRPVHAGRAQLAQGLGDGLRVAGRLGRQRDRRVAGSRPDAVDVRRRVAVEDRAVLGEGQQPRGVLDRLPVGVLRAAGHVVDLLAVQRERHPQLDHRQDVPLPGLHAVAGRLDLADVAGADGRELVPAPGPATSTTRRPATWRLNVRAASSAISAHAASETGASSRCRLFIRGGSSQAADLQRSGRCRRVRGAGDRPGAGGLRGLRAVGQRPVAQVSPAWSPTARRTGSR